MNTRGGEKSEYSDITIRSTSPALLHLNIETPRVESPGEATKVPAAFQSRPKLSRTPPNISDSGNNPQTVSYSDNYSQYSDDNKTNIAEYTHDTLETYQSDKINSPSLSIEYPPGSSIPMFKKRKKFQFKKSHYQKFIGTSSAKKTKEFRKREKSRSNSLISYQSSFETLNLLNANVTKTAQMKPQSVPESPPSDDLIAQIMKKSPHKQAHHLTTKAPVLPSDKSVYSDEITVSSSPSVIEDRTTVKITNKIKTNPGYSYGYRSRQKWKTLIHDDVQKRQQIDKTVSFPSSRSIYHQSHIKKNKHMTFGAKMEPKIDPDEIRIRLHEYDEQKGQNLEEIFRPQKTCWNCIVL